MVATVHIEWVSIITERLCFLYYARTGILLESYLATAYLSCYAIVYSSVFGSAFGVGLIGVGWISIMILWVLNSP